MTVEYSRYLRAALPAMLARTAAATAVLVLPMACGTGDEAAFSAASTSETTVAAATTSTAAAGASLVDESSGAESAAGLVFPAGAELLVSFSYEPSTTGQAERPYIAVWVEDTDGGLVDTISLWFEQGGRGTRWLSDLRQWYDPDGGSDTTMSGATRVAGDYTVVWDGTDADGQPVVQGEYVVNIEAAREQGPYSFTSGTLTVGDAGFTISLPDDGELFGVSAELAV